LLHLPHTTAMCSVPPRRLASAAPRSDLRGSARAQLPALLFASGQTGSLGRGKVMKHRLIQALLLGVPAAATFSMGVSIVQAAEECRLKPDSTAPSGTRWVYRINRADHRHCWHLSSKAAITHTHLAHRYRHLSGDPEAARQDQQGGDSDLQTAFAGKTDVAVAAKLPPMPQAATPSTEQPPDDLIPRSVSTIVYRLPTAGAQTVTAATHPLRPLFRP
jgi:hypothetical protein